MKNWCLLHNKKAVVADVRGIILAAITFVVFLAILLGFMVKLGFFADTVECNWSLVLNQFQNAEIKCRISSVVIDDDAIQAERAYASQRIQLFLQEQAAEKAQSRQSKYAGVTYFTSTESSKLAEFGMNALVAKELASCWRKALGGSTQGYKWWRYVEPSFVDSKKPAELELAYKDGRIASMTTGLLKEYGAPTTCMVCSQIVFDKKLDVLGVPVQVDSMPEFLANNPVLLDSKQRSFYEFLLDGQTQTNKMYAPTYSFHRDVPYVVVYKRVDTRGFQVAGSILGQGILQGVSALARAVGASSTDSDTVLSTVQENTAGVVQTYHTVELVPLLKLREPVVKDPEGGNCVIVLNEAQSLGGTV